MVKGTACVCTCRVFADAETLFYHTRRAKKSRRKTLSYDEIQALLNSTTTTTTTTSISTGSSKADQSSSHSETRVLTQRLTQPTSTSTRVSGRVASEGTGEDTAGRNGGDMELRDIEDEETDAPAAVTREEWMKTGEAR